MRTNVLNSSGSRRQQRESPLGSTEVSPDRFGPELVFAFVGPVGTDHGKLFDYLKTALADVGYQAEEIHLIELMHEFDRWKTAAENPFEERVNVHMDMGNEFRATLGRGDALALLGLTWIRAVIRSKIDAEGKPLPNHAYVLRSLKHPDEVRSLRTIYGSNFFLVGAYTQREKRIENLASRIAESHQDFQPSKYRAAAETLNNRDEIESSNPFGQNVQNTFPLADAFIDCSDETTTPDSLSRFIELVFGHPYHTPTRDEYAMFHAQGAALRSADLSRQVGSVIATPDGDVAAMGTNEVPKGGGGQYWAGDEADHRDFRIGYESNTRLKHRLLADLLGRLANEKWLVKKVVGDPNHMAQKALELFQIKGAQFMNLIEYGRPVHAEMAAIVDAARRGVRIDGLTLYTTTFPCHDCSKHIVGSGISRVVYIEPYPKSLSAPLYPDSISVDGIGSGGQQVSFEPFVGISPRRYVELFNAPDRKNFEGDAIQWEPAHAIPKLGSYDPTTDVREADFLKDFEESLDKEGLELLG